mgnify:CR=1 FL=1
MLGERAIALSKGPRDLRAAPVRADWILQLTNDAWFGSTSEPYEHMALSVYRAVELRLDLLAEDARLLFDSLTNASDVDWTLTGPAGLSSMRST